MAGIKPADIAIGTDGSLFILDYGARALRRVGSDGIIETVGGGLGSPLRPSSYSERLEAGPNGSLFFTTFVGTIWMWGPDGSVEQVAGGGGKILPPAPEGIDPRELLINRQTQWLSWDPAEGLFFSFAGSDIVQIRDGLARRYSAGSGSDAAFWQGRVVYSLGSRIFGTAAGEQTEVVSGFPLGPMGDQATAADVPAPPIAGMVAGRDGKVYMATAGMGTVHALGTDGVLRRFAGTGAVGSGVIASGAPALETALRFPSEVAFDADGDLLIAEFGVRAIRAVGPDGLIHTAVNMSALGSPTELAVSPEGRLYAAYSANGIDTSRMWTRPEGSPFIGVQAASTEAAQFFQPSRILELAALRGGVSLMSDGSSVYRVDADRRAELWSSLLRVGTGMATGSEGQAYMSDTAGRGLWRRDKDGHYQLLTREGALHNFSEGESSTEVVLGVAANLALDNAGNLYLHDSDLDVVRRIALADSCPGIEFPLARRAGVVNAATYQLAGNVAPGMIVSIFGENLGPDTPVSAHIGADGLIATDLDGLRVLFDGEPAPLLFGSRRQISAIVPYSVEGKSQTSMVVEWAGLGSLPAILTVEPSIPGIFTLDSSGSGQAAALNQDGSVNGPANPARAGTIVTLYATGAGQTNPPGVAGRIVGGTLAEPLLPVEVRIRGELAEVLYAGSAPGLADGVLQINFRVPAATSSGEHVVALQVGGGSSQAQPVVSIGP